MPPTREGAALSGCAGPCGDRLPCKCAPEEEFCGKPGAQEIVYGHSGSYRTGGASPHPRAKGSPFLSSSSMPTSGPSSSRRLSSSPNRIFCEDVSGGDRRPPPCRIFEPRVSGGRLRGPRHLAPPEPIPGRR